MMAMIIMAHLSTRLAVDGVVDFDMGVGFVVDFDEGFSGERRC